MLLRKTFTRTLREAYPREERLNAALFSGYAKCRETV